MVLDVFKSTPDDIDDLSMTEEEKNTKKEEKNSGDTGQSSWGSWPSLHFEEKPFTLDDITDEKDFLACRYDTLDHLYCEESLKGVVFYLKALTILFQNFECNASAAHSFERRCFEIAVALGAPINTPWPGIVTEIQVRTNTLPEYDDKDEDIKAKIQAILVAENKSGKTIPHDFDDKVIKTFKV